MKKIFVLLIFCTFTIGLMQLPASKKDKEQLYLEAITAQDPEIKMQKLEEYYEKYGKKKKYQTAPLFVHLVDTAYKVKQFDKMLEYAEAGNKSGKLSEIDKINIKLKLAYYNLYVKKDFKTAAAQADEILAFGRTLNNPACDRMFCAPALRIKIAILETQSNDEESILKALDTSLQAYKIDRSEQSAKFVHYFANKLYGEFGRYDKAIATLETICAAPDALTEHLDKLASWYVTDGFNDKALKYLKISYEKEKNSQKAYLIGKFTYKNNIDKGLEFLAEATVLGEAPYAGQAGSLLEEAYNEFKGQEQTPEQRDEAIQQLIENARIKLNK